MTVRVVGLAVGLLILAIGIIGRRRGRFSRGDLLLWSAFGVATIALSLVPAVADWLTSLLILENRLFAVLVLSIGVLMVLALRQRDRLRHLEDRFGELVRQLAVRAFEDGSGEPARTPVIGVVIPAFNEEEAIAGVLSDLPSEVEGYMVKPIVVVDGSTDRTETVVRRAGYSVATHPVNRGQGDALRTGFKVALARGDDIVVTMDADGQHQTDDLVSLVKPIVAGEADYVQGSRFLGQYDDAGGVREVGIRFFNRVINILGGIHITDCTNGYRAIRAERLALLRLEEDRFSAPEILMEAAANGLRILEVPVHIRSRAFGESKKPRGIGYPIGFLRTIVAVWLRW